MNSVDLQPGQPILDSAERSVYMILIDQYMDRIAQSPTVPLNVEDLGDKKLRDRIAGFSNLYMKHMKNAVAAAENWFVGPREGLIQCYDDLLKFARRYGELDELLTRSGSDGLKFVADDINELGSKVKGWRHELEQFQTRLDSDIATFHQDLQVENAIDSDLSEHARKLRSRISELGREIGENEASAQKKAVDTIEKDLEDAGTAVVQAMGENFGKAIESCCKLAFTTAKFEIEGLILGSESLEKLKEIESLKSELTHTDEAIMVIQFIGQELKSLSEHTTSVTQLVKAVDDFAERAAETVKSIQTNEALYEAKSTSAWKLVATSIETGHSAGEKLPLQQLDLSKVRA